MALHDPFHGEAVAANKAYIAREEVANG